MTGTTLGRWAKRRSPGSHALGLCAALACALGLPSPAAAQTNPDELARMHFQSGAAYFEEAEYGEALKAFQKSYELSHRPDILLNISIVYERMNNLAAAVEMLDQYLEEAPDDVDIDTLRRRRDNLQRRLENVQHPRTGGAQGTTGAATLPAATETPVKETNATPPAPSMRPVVTYSLLGLGAATGVGALVTGLVAQLEYSSLKSSCAGACSSRDTQTGETMAVTSTVLTGVSLVTLGIGAWLWFTPDQEKGVPQVSVTATPQTAFAQARWSF